MDVPGTSSNVSRSSPTSSTEIPVIQASFLETVASLRTEIFEPFIHQFSENERKALSTVESLTPSESEVETCNQMKELVPRLYNEIREILSDSFRLVTSLENFTVNNWNSSENILNPSYHCFNHNDPSQQQNPNISDDRARRINNFTNFQKKAKLLFMKCGLTKQKAKKIVQAIGEKSNCLQFYKYFWRRWYKWCQENSVHHLDCSSFEFLKFLQQFTQGRQPATVNGCCVAICFVIKHAGGSDLAFKAPMIKAYMKRIMSKPKTINSFQQEPASNVISTNINQDTSFFHNQPSHGSSLKSYSDPSCKESSPVSTIENGDCSSNNQDLIQKHIEIEECDNTQFHEEASLNALQQENDCSTSILHDEDSSTHLYISSSSKKALEIENIEVACNSYFNEQMKQLCLQKEIDENFCSSKNNQNPQNGIVQQQNSNISHIARSANNFTDFQIKALLLFMKCGFTEQKAKKVVQAIREKPNSIQWYKCFWRKWYKWCQENSVHHLDCSSFEFLKFLQQFTQGRQPVTVKDCCDAIGRVVMHAGESDLAFKAPMIKAYIKRIMSEPKPVISFQQEPASSAISTNMDQDTSFFHYHLSQDSSNKSYSDPSCKESSPVSTIENGDSSPNNQDLTKKVIRIEECNSIPFHEEASLNALQQENDCSTSISHDEDSSTQPSSSSSSENALEIENIEVDSNSHFNQPMKQLCLKKEIDENICSSKNDDALRKFPDQNDSKEYNQTSTTDNGHTSLNNQDLYDGYSSRLSSSENSLENKNIEVACNSHNISGDIPNQSFSKDFSPDSSHISQTEENSFHSENNELTCSSNIIDSLIDMYVNREDDNIDCSISQSQNSTNISPITPTGPYVFSPFQENIIAALSDQGFTRKLAEEVVQKIGNNEKCLTHYKGHWNRWYKWCHNHSINPLCFSAEELLQYLQNNNADGNKSKPATIKTKFSALYSIITKTGMSTEAFRDPIIRLYLKQIDAEMKETVCCQHNSRTNVVNTPEEVPPKKIKLESYLSSDILNFLY